MELQEQLQLSNQLLWIMIMIVVVLLGFFLALYLMDRKEIKRNADFLRRHGLSNYPTYSRWEDELHD